MLKRTIAFFDRLEDRVRIGLSRYPIAYAMVGAVGVVLIWKGVWETAEYFPALFGPGSILLGLVILLVSGLMVSVFIGDNIIISGFRREKKLIEKTIDEVNKEEEAIERIEAELGKIEGELEELRDRKG